MQAPEDRKRSNLSYLKKYTPYHASFYYQNVKTLKTNIMQQHQTHFSHAFTTIRQHQTYFLTHLQAYLSFPTKIYYTIKIFLPFVGSNFLRSGQVINNFKYFSHIT